MLLEKMQQQKSRNFIKNGKTKLIFMTLKKTDRWQTITSYQGNPKKEDDKI